MKIVPVAALGALLASCMMGGGSHGHLPPGPILIQPEPRSGVPAPPIATDENGDPSVVEIRLTAAPANHAYLSGKPTAVWAFNGSIPGPTIEARVGDEIIVHFSNQLPEPTSIHWHGVRVPNEMDGAGRLLAPIPPGGTFDYRFTVLDAGTFWYHPHVRSDVQVDKGLYGAILVRDPDGPELDVAADLVLVLDDVMVDPATGQAEDGLDMRAMMMGREGNLLLVNGQPSNGSITVAPGQRSRLRLINAANARFFRLAADDGALVQVGSDGGLLPAPRPLNQLLLVPGERAEVVLETAGATLTALPYERAQGAGADGPMPIVRFVSSGEAAVTPLPLPATLRQIETLVATAPVATLRLGERMAHHSWQFTINDRTFPDVPLIDGTLGTRARWSIENESGMDHPFHLHGFFFQQAGVPEWRDTINIPAQSTVELIVDFAARPGGAAGDWLYHCHILEHAEGGMMGEVHVD